MDQQQTRHPDHPVAHVVSRPREAVVPGAVVVGTDGSPGARAAVDWAAAYAALTARPLTVLAAVGPLGLGPNSWLWWFGGTAVALLPEVRQAAGSVAEDEAARARCTWAGLGTTVTVSDLDPGLALIEHGHNASLLVVGSRGHGPVASLLLGSVGATCARKATCPVVVVRPVRSGSRSGGPERGVLVGVDDTPEALVVLEHACAAADLLGLSLTARMCVQDQTEWVAGPHLIPSSAETERTSAARRLLAEILAGLRERYPDVEVHPQLAAGDPAEDLVADSSEHQLVVVGRHARGRGTHLTEGRTAARVVERAGCPVLVIPLPGG